MKNMIVVSNAYLTRDDQLRALEEGYVLMVRKVSAVEPQTNPEPAGAGLAEEPPTQAGNGEFDALPDQAYARVNQDEALREIYTTFPLELTRFNAVQQIRRIDNYGVQYGDLGLDLPGRAYRVATNVGLERAREYVNRQITKSATAEATKKVHQIRAAKDEMEKLRKRARGLFQQDSRAQQMRLKQYKIGRR